MPDETNDDIMKLDPAKQAWLMEPGARAILAAMPDDAARFVGGCVRDAVLGETVGDLDIAVKLEPRELMAALSAANIRYIETGIEHGTVTAVVGGKPYEITSLRRDVETDGRRAVVAFTEDWTEDAQRRDLTMNALYADAEGRVYDPIGQGFDDLKARRFRFVGDPALRVKEDYLRILRFFRFIAFYGHSGTIDAASLAACAAHKDGINRLSFERIWMEIKKLLSAPDPRRAARLMAERGILEEVLPEASNHEGLALLVELEQANGLATDPLQRLMSMAGRDGRAMAALSKRLKLSKAEKKRLLAWALDLSQIDADMDDRAAKQAIYQMGSGCAQDRFIIRAAGQENPARQDGWLSLARLAQSWSPPSFPISGDDLIGAGITPGEEMGRTLKALKALWMKSGFNAGREQLLMALTLMQARG